jgi:phosphate transport system permease protein
VGREGLPLAGGGAALARPGGRPIPRAGRRRPGEWFIHGFLLLCTLVSIFATIGIILSLVTETVRFFRQVPILDFLTDTRWAPLFEPAHFGILPLVAGTVMVAIGASLVALPVGLATAIYLSEYAPDGLRRVVKPVLEVLAGIPTVVYGYFALTLVTPFIRHFIPGANVFNAASASLVMGIMIIPMVSSLSEDAMVAVPRSLREAAYALGATRLEVSTRVVVPAALSGIVASFILAISRAIGETMIVTLAAGATPRLTLSPFESIQTMTAYIVQVSLGDTPADSIAYRSIFAVGMSLFVITLAMNVLGNLVVRRYREVY